MSKQNISETIIALEKAAMQPQLYESMRGKAKIDQFEMINPVVQSTDTMAVLTYNLHIRLGDMLWKENCTEVYRLEDNNEWKIIHCHISPTKPSLL